MISDSKWQKISVDLKNKATEVESVSSSVSEHMRSKRRDLGRIRLQNAQGNSPAASVRDAVKRTSE